MPLFVGGFFIPTSKSIPYLIEDVYVRGGWRTVDDMEELYSIKTAARKFGMVAFVESESTYYHVPGPSKSGQEAWKPLDITKYINVGAGLSLDVDADTGIVTLVGGSGLPDATGTSTGMALILNGEGQPVWGNVSSLPSYTASDKGKSLVVGDDGYSLERIIPDLTEAEEGSALIVSNGELALGTPNTSGGSLEAVDVTVPIGGIPVDTEKTVSVDVVTNVSMVLELSTNFAGLEIELHSTDQFDDDNPYFFVSSAITLSDNGITYNEDATVVKHRRYGFYVDSMGMKKLNVKVKNVGGTDRADVSVDLKLLGMG